MSGNVRSIAALAALSAALGLLGLSARAIGDPPAAPTAPEKLAPAPVPGVTYPIPATPEPAAATPATPKAPARAKAPKRPAATNTVEQALAAQADLNFDATPLNEVLDALAVNDRVNIVVDEQALKEASISDDVPITVNLRGITLRNGLRLILPILDLDYYPPAGEGENVLLITTREKAQSHLTTRAYDVSDLTPAAEDFTDQDSAMHELISAITGVVAPSTWDNAGGTGSVVAFERTLLVSQTGEVHEQIEALLAALRAAQKQQEAAPGGPAIAASVSGSTAAEDKIRHKLNDPVDLDFAGKPLIDVVDTLKQKCRIEVQLDEKALKEANISDDTPITFRASQMRLSTALKLIPLPYYVEHDVLLITTSDKEKRHLETEVYPVGDLIDAPAGDPEGMRDEFDSLIEAITCSVTPTSWSDAGGSGSISPYAHSRVLIVAQPREFQAGVADMLSKLRAVRKNRKPAGAAPDPTTPVVRMYELLPSTTLGLLPVKLPAPPIGKNYAKTVPPPAPSSEFSKEVNYQTDKYVDAIKHVIAPESWSKEGVYIQALPGHIVVRQPPAIQAKIRHFLVEAKAMLPHSPAGQ